MPLVFISGGGVLVWSRLIAGAIILLLPLAGQAQESDEDPRDAEIERLRKMVLALEARVAALEGENATMSAAPAASLPIVASPVEPVASPGIGEADGSGSQRLDAVEASAEEPESDPIAFTGALRFNVSVNEDTLDSKKGESGLDLFRIGAEGTIDDFILSAEYRFYTYMDTIHHGWIGYAFGDSGKLKFGIAQVPFGILPYASHNYWFGVPYYLGLADDYDLGLVYEHTSGPWDLKLAFFKNGEMGDATNLERYSFDLVQAGDQANEESNQLNAWAAYSIGKGSDSVHEFGISGQIGEVYNSITDDNGYHWAAGIHLDSRYKRWNFQLELARYAYHPENPVGISDETVRLGAFATSYDISSKGTVGVFNVAYNLPVTFFGLNQILIYNDFSVLWKDMAGSRDSMLNTTGIAFGKGPLFMYLDFIQARNMVFFDGGSLAGGGNDSWSSLLNFNIGYYW